jgi:ELWxxDGT repeat protein
MPKRYPFSICLLFILSMLSGCLDNLDTNGEDKLTPYLVKDINPGHYSSNPSEGIPINGNKLIFPASDGSNGTTLWVSDGSTIGTRMIQNISIDENDEYSDSPHFDLFSFGDIVFFEISYGSHSSLWSTDGISASLVADLNTNDRNDHYDPRILIGEDLIFSSNARTWGHYEEYRYNLNDGIITRLNDMTNIFQWNDEYYFSRDSSLFRLNPVDYSEQLIFDFDTNNSLEEPIYWHEIRILNVNKIIFCIGEEDSFIYTDPYVCEEIWLSDGTSNGTQLLKDNPAFGGLFTSGDRPITDYEVLNGNIFISTSSGHLYQLHLDGNQSIVRDLYPGSGDRIEEIHATSGFIYFEAYDGSTNWYMSDGTFEGTTRWKANSGYPDIIYENDEQIVLGFDNHGMHLFEEETSTKIADGNWAGDTLGLTSTHLYISGESTSGDVGTELWAIQY